MQWNEGITRPVALAELGQTYRRYRLADPHGEEAMAGSLRRWGQLAPLAACVRDEKLELLDGFKRNDLLRPYSSQSASSPNPPSNASHGQICGVEPASAVARFAVEPEPRISAMLVRRLSTSATEIIFEPKVAGRSIRARVACVNRARS